MLPLRDTRFRSPDTGVVNRPRLSASTGPARPVTGEDGTFTASMLYAAAKMYYEDGATQAEVAEQLGTSRATVSKLLAEARRVGVVTIAVQPLAGPGTSDLARELEAALGLDAVYLSAAVPGQASAKSAENVLGSVLAPAVGRALEAVGLLPGDVLLVSSGRTIYEVAQFDLPDLSGVVIAPTLGGMDQPEGWYQTNEISRLLAARTHGRALYLFAPALPGPDLYATLQRDPAIQRVLHLWPHALCALVGIGAPPLSRPQLPQFVAPAAPLLFDAVGDICSRFYDRAGQPLEFPGSDRLMGLDLATLSKIPAVIAVAAGQDKVGSIIVGAKARFFTQLVTDPVTAESILTKQRSRRATLERPRASGN